MSMEQTTVRNTIRDHVADTLYIPLYMKSNETKRRKGVDDSVHNVLRQYIYAFMEHPETPPPDAA